MRLALTTLVLLTLAGCDSPVRNSEDAAAAHADMPALESEEIGSVETLSGLDLGNVVFVHDLNFNTLTQGKLFVIDAAAQQRQFRGQIDAAQFATFQHSARREELYVAETFYSRGSRGERTDVLTIYDLRTLVPATEIVLPSNSRLQSVTQRGAFQLIDNDRFALIATFTPATGVIVVDLEQREVVNEIDTPGCTLIYPRTSRGFGSLCGNGSMIAFDLDEAGQVVAQFETSVFNDVDENPMFMKAVSIGETTYFPTFGGHLQPVSMGEGVPVPGTSWHFSADTTWRPAGWQIITADRNGLIYVLMRENALEGDHKSGGTEVWVLNAVERELVRRIELTNDSLSIEATQSDRPLLMVSNIDGSLDIYNLSDDMHVRQIGNFMAATPFALHAARGGS